MTLWRWNALLGLSARSGISFLCLAAFAVTALSSGFADSLQAQTSVALLDMAVVFENHPAFKSRLAQLKQDADGLQTAVLQQRQALIKEQENLRLLYQPGSQEFKDKEKELALKVTQLEIDSNDKMRDLMVQEAKLHFEIYSEVSRLVDEYCNQFDIRLVLRFNSAAVQPDKPESVMQQVNGAIVYYNPNRDITAAIVQRVAQVRGAASP
ncbi:MAG: OmpH family outer membrane protein, partial [Planctomycetota bacterium]